MIWLKFGTLTVGALTTTLLLGVITGYLLSRRNKPPEAWYLTGYLAVIFILTLSYSVRYVVFSSAALVTGQISNLIVFGVVSLIQFAYHYGKNPYPRESRFMLIASLVISTAVWISIFFEKELQAVYDFRNQYFSYEFGPRIGIVTLPGFIWASVVFLRKAGKKTAGSNKSFALLTLFTAILPMLYLLFQLNIISRAAYNLMFNTGALLVCVAIFTVYVNNSPLPTSYMIKITGIPLVVVLAAFGITTNALMPVIQSSISERYYNDLKQTRLALETGYDSIIPDDVVFIIPEDEKEGAYQYLADNLYTEDTSLLRSAPRHEGLITMISAEAPGFFYLDLQDTSSFFFSFNVHFGGIPYLVGFQYGSFREAIHKFVVRIVILLSITAVAVLLGFPILFRIGLLKPLENLLDGVKQVTLGNYRLKLAVSTGDELGQLAGGFNMMVDSLLDVEGNFKALAENANDAILILSAEGLIVFANRKAAETSGYSFGSLRNMHFSTLIPDKDLKELLLIFNRQTLETKGSASFETRTIRRDGKLIPVEITAAATLWQGESANVVIIRDISERKKAEEILQDQQHQLMKMDKMASLGAMVAGFAHEVNNPNQAISMNLGFVNESLNGLFTLAESGEEADNTVEIGGMGYDDFKSTIHSTIGEIGDSTRRIDHIVKELKRLVRGDSKPEYRAVEINDVVKIVADLSRHMIRQSTDIFSMELAEGLPAIYADQIGLEQVVLNLLQNGCQALKDRSGAIEIRTYQEDTDGKVCLEIRDEGRGIRKKDIPRLTDSFFTTRGDSGGTGLGLSVSSRIIREHQGELSFVSAPGKGTTVTVRLPACPDQPLSS